MEESAKNEIFAEGSAEKMWGSVGKIFPFSTPQDHCQDLKWNSPNHLRWSVFSLVDGGGLRNFLYDPMYWFL